MKNSYQIKLNFTLTTKKGEELDKHSLKAFKNQVYNFCYDWDGYFYAYCDNKDGTAYDTDINPTNVKVKLRRL